ncbi:hypothetical protein HPB48_021881 [Haemaphysalis longicornis]|uniref:Carboxylesterase type B domain-containing protein n=1 Tax=Haemaphysalis longicornis TaxID=44386 RepID=A0A9J6GS38_HAELO|nr:hypothetical protein HPB48_021881 [Haemaphysalis longicornis]
MPGNLALHDQEEAMRWLHEHVQWFGGDLNRTVLMGAGTGAWSLGAHLLSKNPLWRWRYPRLIMHSESAFRRHVCTSTSMFRLSEHGSNVTHVANFLYKSVMALVCRTTSSLKYA